METLEQPDSASPGTQPDLNQLEDRERAEDWRRSRSSAVVSLAVHAVGVTALLLMPGTPIRPVPPDEQLSVHVTPVFEPTDLTQTAPNKGPISKEITAEAIAPRPLIKSPSPAPAAARPAPAPTPPPPSAPPPPPAVAPAPPKPIIVEPPRVQPDLSATQAPEIAKIIPAAPAPAEPPKLALENPAAAPIPAQGRSSGAAIAAAPNPSVQEAVRNLTQTVPQGGQSVGDLGADEGGAGLGLNLPPSAGRPKSNLELRSDPMGVDFRPYLLQVLAAVRRNWFAVYPEAARLGQRGQVTLEFAIVKQGTIAKVVFTGQSGAKALDQAAVAAISASNPLPQLPTAFRGDRVVLSMTFMYNMQR